MIATERSARRNSIRAPDGAAPQLYGNAAHDEVVSQGGRPHAVRRTRRVLARKARPTGFDALRRAMIALFPDLADLRSSISWSGYVGMTFNSLPHVGRRRRRHDLCLGYSGAGVADGDACSASTPRRSLSAQTLELALLAASQGLRPVPFHSAARAPGVRRRRVVSVSRRCRCMMTTAKRILQGTHPDADAADRPRRRATGNARTARCCCCSRPRCSVGVVLLEVPLAWLVAVHLA